MSRLPLGREQQPMAPQYAQQYAQQYGQQYGPQYAPQYPPQQRSNIPTMRRDRRKQLDTAAATLRERQSRERMQGGPLNSSPSSSKSETRWDPSTGEPTTADRGRAGQVRPAEYAQEFGANAAPPLALRSTHGGHNFGERVRRSRPPPPAPSAQVPPAQAPPIETRPEWKGASGRTTLVNPVRDTPEVAPLNIPRKSSKRASRAIGAAGGPHSPLSPISPSGSETSLNAGPLSIRRIVPSSQQQPIPAPLQSPASQSAAQAYPSPPNSGSPIQSSINAAPTSSINQGLASLSSPKPEIGSENANAETHASPDIEKAIRRKPPPAHSNATSTAHSAGAATHAPHLSTSSSVYSQYPEPPSQPAKQAPQHTGLTPYLGGEEAWTQPPSRFSVTTYATSAQTDSPRPSVDDDAPPVPAMPPQPSILDRKRPMVPGNWGPAPKITSEPILISMDSPYMSSPFTTTNSMTGAGALPTRSKTDLKPSMSKALPPAPPEISSVNDRIAHLNAKLEALANRRININRSIKQMTELMPTDSIIASEAVIRKRESEKRKVEGLRMELSEVQREEYELGLKLHRAYKRMDRDAEFEPTTLWVRRVTG